VGLVLFANELTTQATSLILGVQDHAGVSDIDSKVSANTARGHRQARAPRDWVVAHASRAAALRLLR